MKCAGFLWSGDNDTTSTTATADGESADTTELELTEHSVEDERHDQCRRRRSLTVC